MSVTVVIPTHNRREGLTGLLRDLREQEGVDTDVEVLVVDSDAGEDISDVVQNAAAEGQNVRRVLTDNQLTAKRNAGAIEATGDLLCFLDDDMRLPPTWLRGHLDAHATYPDACVSGDIQFPREWISSSNYYSYKQAQHRNSPAHAMAPVRIPPHRVVAMNLSIPREIFMAIGGNDPDFKRYGGEDIEFGFRAARAGVPLVLAPAAWAWHHEVKLDVVGFARKLYTAAYEGAPLVVEKAPEARAVRTFRWSEPGMQHSLGDRLAHDVGKALARPAVVAGLASILRRTDKIHALHARLPYQVLTALVTQLAVGDRVAGRPNRAGDLFG